MFPVPQLPKTSYTMSVKLGEVLTPDTNLHVQIFGEKGETSKIMLRPVGTSFNRFEKGRTYKFTVETVDIGKIQRLRIGHDARGPGKGIFVEEVDVLPSDGERATFPCSCWLSEDKADSKIERDVLPGKPKPPRPNVSYHLAIKTADVPNAGTDANVYFQLIGDEAETEKIQLRQGGKSEKRFERGRTDKFIVETVDVGP
ncbi:lipoxygenase homology domain-containing protein 1-like, partial [Actinia tenebrosa]